MFFCCRHFKISVAVTLPVRLRSDIIVEIFFGLRIMRLSGQESQYDGLLSSKTYSYSDELIWMLQEIYLKRI